MRVIILACLMVFSTGAVLAESGPLPSKPHLYVAGSGEVRVPPDQMAITVGLEETAKELAQAKATVDERSRRLIKAVKELGISPQDLSTTALQISPAYEWRDGQQIPLGTRVYRQVDITLRDLNKYQGLMAALVDAEISNTVNTRLEVSDDEALADQALLKAVEDARERAQSMAKAVGRKLGPTWSVSEFDLRRDERNQLFTVRGRQTKTSRESTPMQADIQGEPFEPGLIVAEAQVYIVFLLK